MLLPSKLVVEFNRRSQDFRSFAERESAEVERLGDALTKVLALKREALDEIAETAENIAAFPAGEFFEARALVLAFGLSWNNHNAARQWADVILTSRTTFAADGSQIYAGTETTTPVAAVQIGWFENPHDAGKRYEKNSSFELITPDDLFRDQDEPMNPDVRVDERRYIGEVDRIIDFLRSKVGWRKRGERMPMAFFDNPLLVPFSQKGLQKSLVNATVDLVRISKETVVPVVGYVDRSYSRDIVTMLGNFVHGANHREGRLVDGAFLNTPTTEGKNMLENWGDRTAYFYARRRGLEALIDPASGRPTVGFTYLRTTGTSPPARIDIPTWCYEVGFLSEIIDVVRAECIIGLGYPYPLETADQTAMISLRDREIFLEALQRFAKREKLEFGLSRKNASKSRRR